MTDDLPRREVRGTVFVWSRAREMWVCQSCGCYVGDYPKHGGCRGVGDAS